MYRYDTHEEAAGNGLEVVVLSISLRLACAYRETTDSNLAREEEGQGHPHPSLSQEVPHTHEDQGVHVTITGVFNLPDNLSFSQQVKRAGAD